jgi:hypothetical protein
MGDYIRERAAETEAKRKLLELTLISGIDPVTDIDSLTIAGIDEDSSKVIVWITGRFDGDRLNQLAQIADQHQSASYHNRLVHSWVNTKEHNKPQAGCLVQAGLLIFSEDVTAIHAAIDVLDGRSQALGTEDALHQALPNLEAPFLVAAAAGGHGCKGKGAKSAFVQQLNSIGLSATEDNDRLVLQAQAIATDAATATRLRDMAQGLLALGSFNENILKLPVAAEALKTASISANGSTLQASVSCELDTLEAAANARLPK